MADKKIASLQTQLQSSSIAFQKIEAELAGVIEARQRLDSQLSENELVLKEFNQLKSHNTVYKLVGPSLVPQDQNEAKVNVEKRLDFIKSEIKRVEAQLKDSEEKAAKKKDEIMGLQQQFQALQGPNGPQQTVQA
ncbi:prefoldin beta subunit [Kwoniella mangroviensis CBS 10435]|uniref:Prefoldin beta subunit n=1 Tax=Kwoniella mangroviensis CBS 10435 TaxID=1331196 RepID=A0A1B9IRP9_9TREE|nr:prefoldin beta subunit [Kwoniella mangroviensis CBS 10435]